MMGMDSRLENGEDVNELGRKASVETVIGSSCAELELEEKEKQKGWQTDFVSGSDDAEGRKWVMVRWSGQLGGCEMHQCNPQNT